MGDIIERLEAFMAAEKMSKKMLQTAIGKTQSSVSGYLSRKTEMPSSTLPLK